MVEADARSVEGGPVSVPPGPVQAMPEATAVIAGAVEAGPVADMIEVAPRRDIDDAANGTAVNHDRGNIVAVIVNGWTIAITVIVGRIAVAAIPVSAVEPAKHGTADQAGCKRATEPEASVVEAAAEAASGKSSMVEPAHVATTPTHPSLSRDGNADRGHSEHGGC
jgi:hypothetical protein